MTKAPPMLLCLAAVVPALAACGGDQGGAAAARPAAPAPLEITLEPEYRSGVTGTARLAPAGAKLKVTLTLDSEVPGILLAHLHAARCRDELDLKDPRIRANLTEVVDGRSETTLDIVTLEELRSTHSSIVVHDAANANRPLVCADIPRSA
ncbi:MAG TPA: hypothetical protein VFZ00_14625 [Solirubrobacter sp.]|nr:hypothetical protein [Solirubrobacter sp.]